MISKGFNLTSAKIRECVMQIITSKACEFERGVDFIKFALQTREQYESEMNEEDNEKVSNMSVAILKCYYTFDH